MHDGTLRAEYAIEDNGKLMHHRVSYDIERVIRNLDVIDPKNARTEVVKHIKREHPAYSDILSEEFSL